MCGIVGYVGSKNAAPIIVEGLRKLEYRGYDSAGIAIHDGKGIEIVRTLGKLARLSEALEKRTLEGGTGIGHTRWATHGRPSEVNAHPHSSGPVALVHNGIIENYVAIRHELEGQGVKFSSDTDTEVMAHLIHRELSRGVKPLFKAAQNALKLVHGAYAIAVMSRDEPGVVVVARYGSPLVLGVCEGESMCGSDIPALLSHTRDMIFLEDGDVAELRADGIRIETVSGEIVQRKVRRIDWSPVMAERGGYKHFMLKEIHEQPDVVEQTLRGRIDVVNGDVYATEIGVTPEAARAIKRVYITACGTSHHAGIAGRYWIEQLARVPTVVELASEVRYRDPIFYPDDLVIAISQSGETADTIAALKAAKAQGAKVLALCNVVDSAIPRASDGALYTHAGPEIGVASTKCFTTQLAALLMLAVYLGRRRETLAEDRAREILQALLEIPGQMRDVLGDADYVHAIAKKMVHAKDVLFLGRGLGFPIALEGALKLKEISYAHAEGYAAGEMKHGPIALIDESLPVVVICPRDAHFEKTVSNLEEVRAREGQVIAIATKGDEQILEKSQFQVWLPKVRDEVLPLLTVLPLQLISYYVANLKGNDVDQPRNLAKTVTVE
ncbi:glutamine--fructose-6-phosphate transaminase (isomerizing) [Chondromyces apiculatus]|uniref:Glutamine--fructose-6-phosphate aminotransferase [isomerizing] n=1 Tax=Chondromyces apiculatus DSM 436 TaxID=1192034 RepID=A0A017SZX2_9BACT|nr:glutamine--fructose-6-phosphate transaminase (isomerizing) [Chondromyces apiculatus]EYF02140.1 Glucosamine--fructose-6-phosphate aminotransferase [Chondromyces apiculatus DSM 436]